MQQQFQFFFNIWVWWLQKPGFRVVENSQKNGFWVRENPGWKHYLKPMHHSGYQI